MPPSLIPLSGSLHQEYIFLKYKQNQTVYLQCLQQTIQIPHNTEPCLHEVASGPRQRLTFPSAIHPTTLNTRKLWNQPCSLRFHLGDASILEILPLPFLPLQSLILQNLALVSCSPRRRIQLPWTVKPSREKHESSFITMIHHLFPLCVPSAFRYQCTLREGTLFCSTEPSA